ncbi:MAG: hypothetical protein HOD28_01410 [Candidatus Marinimicrobia bacterium]|nr:hypothetical protein [Candidatus Neomarinimicrobiota bacterium]MBT4382248.1 hypothetical protein [Candidatus Neomarinimicrobiota bacterium]MBT5069686.1 hypothetical protein [Candidatus Neomarinimicrobiota bacterium]
MEKSPNNFINYNSFQLYGLITIRILASWHFLYESISIITNPYWSSVAEICN